MVERQLGHPALFPHIMTGQVLHLDFETRSFVNLFEAGAYNYAKDPTTSIICMAYAFDEGPVALWIPSDPFPEEVDKFMAAAAPRSLHAHKDCSNALLNL